MAEHTPIEWTAIPGHVPTTQNPIMGCRKRSAGCGLQRWADDRKGGCFAINEVVRQKHLPGRADLVHYNDDGELDWTGNVALLAERLKMPYRWRVPHSVFVSALGELFDAKVPDEYRAAQWCTMWWTSSAVRGSRRVGAQFRPVHQYWVLTKLAGPMRAWLRKWGDRDTRVELIRRAVERGWCDAEDLRNAPWMDAVLDNVWLGVSVEDQEQADIRVPVLLDTPAAVRFLSVEPLIGPVDLSTWLATGLLHMVIVGGESDKGVKGGKRARPMNPVWVTEIMMQIGAAPNKVAFFFKQWGAFGPIPPETNDDGSLTDYAQSRKWIVDYQGRFARHDALVAEQAPADADAMTLGLRDDDWGKHPRAMYLVGKKAAGDLFRGQRYHQWPEIVRNPVAA